MGRLPWLLGGLAAAGIIHIVSVFSIPHLAQLDAWSRLAAAVKPNTLAIADGKAVPRLPFTPPDVVTAYCLFDVSADSLAVSATLPEPAWSVALSTRSGENFYLVTGADAKHPQVRLLIVPRGRLSEEASTERTAEGDEQTIIASPAHTGIVAIRAPLRGESYRGRAMSELGKAHCDVQKRTEPLVAVADPEITPPAEAKPAQQQPQQQFYHRRPRRPF